MESTSETGNVLTKEGLDALWDLHDIAMAVEVCVCVCVCFRSRHHQSRLVASSLLLLLLQLPLLNCCFFNRPRRATHRVVNLQMPCNPGGASNFENRPHLPPIKQKMCTVAYTFVARKYACICQGLCESVQGLPSLGTSGSSQHALSVVRPGPPRPVTFPQFYVRHFASNSHSFPPQPATVTLPCAPFRSRGVRRTPTCAPGSWTARASCPSAESHDSGATTARSTRCVRGSVRIGLIAVCGCSLVCPCCRDVHSRSRHSHRLVSAAADVFFFAKFAPCYCLEAACVKSLLWGQNLRCSRDICLFRLDTAHPLISSF